MLWDSLSWGERSMSDADGEFIEMKETDTDVDAYGDIISHANQSDFPAHIEIVRSFENLHERISRSAHDGAFRSIFFRNESCSFRSHQGTFQNLGDACGNIAAYIDSGCLTAHELYFRDE